MEQPTASPNGKRASRLRTRSLWGAIRNNLPLVLGLPIATVAMTLAFIVWVPPLYEASVTIRIDEERTGVAVLQILESLSSGSEVHTEMAVMRSRTLAENVVESLGLQLILERPTRTPRSEVVTSLQVDRGAPEATYRLRGTGPGVFEVIGEFWGVADIFRPLQRPKPVVRSLGQARVGQLVELEGVRFVLTEAVANEGEVEFEVLAFDDAVEELQEALAVTQPDREADVVLLRYRSPDPQLVTLVTNTLADRFISRRQEVQSTEARSTVRFLGEQIDTLDGQLRESEEELRDFREANQIVSVEDEASTQLMRLADLQARRDFLEAERRSLEGLMEEIAATGPSDALGQSAYRRLIGFPTILQNQAASELLRLLGELENKRTELLVRQTPENRDVQVVTARIRDLEGQLRTLTETYLDGLTRQTRAFAETLDAFQGELATVPAKEMTYIRLRRRAEILSDIYTLIQTRQKEAEIAAAIEDVSIRVVDPAIRPREPVRPRPTLSLLLGTLLGAVMGVGSAVVREQSDRSIRHRDELLAITGVPVLGLIPAFADGRNGAKRDPRLARRGRKGVGPRLVSELGSGSPATEAYRALRTNLTFSRPEGDTPKVLVFTSPMPGDGKSSTAANLALILAQHGGRVLLVDADLRRGALHDTFSIPPTPGLSDVLVGSADLQSVLHTVEVDEGVVLDLIPTGTPPPNAAELLGSVRMQELLRRLGDSYDTILFDTPPLNLVTDAAILGGRVDGVILVARSGVTEEEPLEFAVDQLEKVQARVLGTVLNGVQKREQEYHGSGKGRAYRYYRGRG